MAKLDDDDLLLVTKLTEWRKWLRSHHAKRDVVWLVFYKKHTGKPSIEYGDALDEALCWGWIDSLVRRMDDERFARKFTPRKDPEKWSDVNVRHLQRLFAAGRMKPAGEAMISKAVMRRVAKGAPSRKPAVTKKGTAKRAPAKPISVPPELQAALAKSRKARKSFEDLAPSHRRNYALWVGSAKRAETRGRRAEEAVTLLARGEKLGMK